MVEGGRRSHHGAPAASPGSTGTARRCRIDL